MYTFQDLAVIEKAVPQWHFNFTDFLVVQDSKGGGRKPSVLCFDRLEYCEMGTETEEFFRYEIEKGYFVPVSTNAEFLGESAFTEEEQRQILALIKKAYLFEKWDSLKDPGEADLSRVRMEDVKKWRFVEFTFSKLSEVESLRINDGDCPPDVGILGYLYFCYKIGENPLKTLRKQGCNPVYNPKVSWFMPRTGQIDMRIVYKDDKRLYRLILSQNEEHLVLV